MRDQHSSLMIATSGVQCYTPDVEYLPLPQLHEMILWLRKYCSTLTDFEVHAEQMHPGI